MQNLTLQIDSLSSIIKKQKEALEKLKELDMKIEQQRERFK